MSREYLDLALKRKTVKSVSLWHPSPLSQMFLKTEAANLTN